MQIMSKFIVITLIFLINLAISSCGPQVNLRQGILEGFTTATLKNRTIFAFGKVPYGQPPVGNLRFKPPQPAGNWRGVKNASILSPECVQSHVFSNVRTSGDEDCLHLDIFTPALAPANLSVMVFFHGGAFVFGGNAKEFNPSILLDQDIVYVLVHYRLGALGFLSTGDSASPGNYGLKDQTLALQWIRDNVQEFGGDPKSVTIFGQSAGGASVHFHILSPLSKGLFHKAISQGGVAINPWALAPSNGQNTKNTKKLAQIFNCKPTWPSFIFGSDNNQLVECLRRVPAEKILLQDHIFEQWDLDPIVPFKPVVEPNLPGAFLSEHPITIMESGNFNQVPWILGVNTDEGCYKVPRIYGNSSLLKEFNENFEELAPVFFQYDQTSYKFQSTEVTNKLREYYLGNQLLNEKTRMKFVQMVSDGFFVYGTDVVARLFLKYSKSPLYLYQFDYKGTFTYAGVLGDSTRKYGICHCDELPIIFDTREVPLNSTKPYSVKDRKMSEVLTTLWSNFANNGDPTPGTTKLIPNLWTPVKSDSTEYFYINVDRQIMKKGFFTERMKIWRSFGAQVHP